MLYRFRDKLTCNNWPVILTSRFEPAKRGGIGEEGDSSSAGSQSVPMLLDHLGITCVRDSLQTHSLCECSQIAIMAKQINEDYHRRNRGPSCAPMNAQIAIAALYPDSNKWHRPGWRVAARSPVSSQER
jgi:hypothetical protein